MKKNNNNNKNNKMSNFNCVNYKAYIVIGFYGLFCLLTAFLGSFFGATNKTGKDGFSIGYLVGVMISVILWMTIGYKMMN
jgi:hypothetical protein